MPNTETKRYQKIEEAEIELVVSSKDSHEFYERYMEVFPDKKKGIDSISKIWKRRSEFIKKRQEAAAKTESPAAGAAGAAPGQAVSSPELEKLIAAQNLVLGELAGVMKEHLKVSREISVLLAKQNQIFEEHAVKHEGAKVPAGTESKEPDEAKKHKHERPPGNIVVGS